MASTERKIDAGFGGAAGAAVVGFLLFAMFSSGGGGGGESSGNHSGSGASEGGHSGTVATKTAAAAGGVAFIGVETYDATGNTTISLCFNGDQLTSTSEAASAKQNELEQTITSPSCEIDLTNMDMGTGADLYNKATGHLGAVITGTEVNGSATSITITGMHNPNITQSQ